MKNRTQKSLQGGGPGRFARFGDGAKRLFFAVFAAVFFILFFQVVFGNMHFNFHPVPTLIATALWLGLFFGLYKLTVRFSAFLEKREKWCLLGFWLLLIATQVFYYWQMAATTPQDLEKVYWGAMNYAIGGYIEDPFLSYFCVYPNNMPLMIILQFLFRAAHRVGITDFYNIGVLLNVVCYWLTYLFVYVSCRRLFSVARGFFALGLLWLCIPLHSYLSFFYTDTISMAFVAMAFYLYLRFRDAKGWKKRLLWLGLMVLAVSLGTKIKYSVVIVLIAIGIDLLLRGEWKRFLAAALAFACCYFLVATAFDEYMYANILPRERVLEESHPFNGWIMMGMKGDGAINPDDNYYVWAWPTKEERIQKTNEEIIRRLKEHGPGGYLLFLNQKGIRSFGSGALDSPDWIAMSTLRVTLMVDMMAPTGKYYPVFKYVMQGYHVALFVLLIAGAVMAWRRKNVLAFVPYLATMGIYLFLLFWEASPRYLTNYFSMYMLAAAFAAGMVFDWHGKKAKRQLAPGGSALNGTDMAQAAKAPEALGMSEAVPADAAMAPVGEADENENDNT